MNQKPKKNTWVPGIVTMLFFLLVAIDPALSDDHKERKHQPKTVYGSALDKKDHGNEITGEIAAWMFGVANFPVALSIILKTFVKIPVALNLRDPLTKFNRQQKKHLMKLHYWLNPIALGVASTHFLLSTCRSTTLPEWGLAIMLVTVLLGLMMKFKLSTATMRQKVFKLHTSPILLISAISILLIGHTIAD